MKLSQYTPIPTRYARPVNKIRIDKQSYATLLEMVRGTNKQSALVAEALLLSRYLIGEQPTPSAAALYAQTANQRTASQNQRTLTACVRHPWLLPYLDAHDAWFRPNSPLRQRLYLMFSILEAQPDFTEKFLPTEHSAWYLPVIAFLGARSVFRLIVGSVIVKVRGL